MVQALDVDGQVDEEAGGTGAMGGGKRPLAECVGGLCNNVQG